MSEERLRASEYAESPVPRRRVTLALVCLIAAGAAACGPSESDIRREVHAKLAAAPAIDALSLSVEVKRRVVYLSGQTATPEEQQQAMELARSVEGVKLVVNDMWVNNAALADKVKAALASDSLVGKVPIEVDAHGDTVRLMSDQTNQEERARAMEIASAVDGVAQVEDRMR